MRNAIKSILTDTAVDDSYFAEGSEIEQALMKLLRRTKRDSLINYLEGLAQINKALHPGMRLTWNGEVVQRLRYTLNYHTRIWRQMTGKRLDNVAAEDAILDFYRRLVEIFHKIFPEPKEPTHKVTNYLKSGTYTKEVKTMITNDGIFSNNTILPMEYQGFTYHIEGSPGNYRYVIHKDGQQIDNSIAPFHGVVPANQSARMRIDELAAIDVHETPVDTPQAKRRGRRRKIEPITELPTIEDIIEEEESRITPQDIIDSYTFDAQEDAELVKVETTEEDW